MPRVCCCIFLTACNLSMDEQLCVCLFVAAVAVNEQRHVSSGNQRTHQARCWEARQPCRLCQLAHETSRRPLGGHFQHRRHVSLTHISLSFMITISLLSALTLLFGHLTCKNEVVRCLCGVKCHWLQLMSLLCHFLVLLKIHLVLSFSFLFTTVILIKRPLKAVGFACFTIWHDGIYLREVSW